MKIEIMTKEHILAVAGIEREAFGAENAEKTLLKELENKISFYFVAIDGGEIAGYLGIWNLCGEADIINIAVRKSRKREGIGSLLLDYVKDFCEKNGIASLNLEVRESNAAARAFYLRNGFKETGERKRYYEGKETAVLMRLDIEKTEDLS